MTHDICMQVHVHALGPGINSSLAAPLAEQIVYVLDHFCDLVYQIHILCTFLALAGHAPAVVQLCCKGGTGWI